MFVDPAGVPATRDAFLTAREVLVVRSGAYTGDAAQITDRWAGSVAGYDIVLTPPDGWQGEFLEQFLLSPFIQNSYFESQKVRAGQPHLNTTQLDQTPAYSPPEPLQQIFAERVRTTRELRQKVVNGFEKLNDVFSDLLQASFSGSLTAKWRDAHMKELLAEIEVQARQLNLPMPQEAEV
jgi:type I restriction enzyme S subunit